MSTLKASLMTVLVLAIGACTLVSPDAPPPSATLPDVVLTPVTASPPAQTDTAATETTDCVAINEDVLAMRVTADIMAEEVTILDAETTTTVIGRTGDNTYWRVRTTGGQLGWIDSSAAKLYGDCQRVPIIEAPPLSSAASSTPSVPTASIKVNLNVRRGPSVRFNPPLGQLNEGETAEIIAVNTAGDWYKVVWEGSQGWISGAPQYVDVSGSTAGLPVDAGPPTPTATDTPIPSETPIPSTPTPTLDPNTNYLSDPGFEGNYTGRSGFPDLNVPEAWQITYFQQPRNYEWQNLRPYAFPHRNPPEIHGGDLAQNLNRDYATFTAVLYQQANVPANIRVQASAWAWLHTCDPQPAICGSNPESGARVRVGIDPNGGTNALADSVVWSDFITPHDTWGNVGTSVQANGSVVTVFLYATQDTTLGLNRVYWDDAQLNPGG